ncbi:MAG: diaminopimelate decarboxylase [Microbacteriaceae bacterium]
MAVNPLAPAWLTEPSDANALAAAVWPANVSRTADGVLAVAGVPATAIAGRFGTPVYVIDEANVRDTAAAVREVFQREFARVGGQSRVYYAGKAFLCADLARWVSEAGLHIDVCTGGELAVVIAAGIDPARLGFHGNNKSMVEIDAAVRAGVGAIVIDSWQEIDRIAYAAARQGVVQPVRLRVNSGVHAHTHEYLATAHEDQKFGLPIADAPAAVCAIRARPSLSFLGLHCHIGSQIFGADGFAESASRLLAVHAALLADGPVPELNLGGGFGIAYTTADRPTPIGQIARRIADVVAARCTALSIPLPLVAFEPGRLVVGGSTLTLYTVGTTKDVPVPIAPPEEEEMGATAVRKYVSIDGGMSDNVRPALYGADYSARIAGRVSAAGTALVRVAGKHCESGDIVVDADYLPADVMPGDLLAVAATGAYCWSLSSNYNYQGRPPVIAVRDGQARLLIRAETVQDLLARDTGISHAVPDRETTDEKES